MGRTRIGISYVGKESILPFESQIAIELTRVDRKVSDFSREQHDETDKSSSGLSGRVEISAKKPFFASNADKVYLLFIYSTRRVNGSSIHISFSL